MNKPPAFQFYAAEWLAEEAVQLMSLEEEGAYIRLLAHCWREGSIPADEEKLSRLCKGASTTVLRVVVACFKQHPEDPSRYIHKRLEAEREKQKEFREKSSVGGKISAHNKAQAKVSAQNKGDAGTSRVVEPPFQANGNSLSLSLKERQVPPASEGEAQASADTWNENCGALPQVREVSEARNKVAKQRCKQGLTPEAFGEAVALASRTPFLRGESDRKWVCNFDWLMKKDNMLKVMEGEYGKPDPPKLTPVPVSPEVFWADEEMSTCLN